MEETIASHYRQHYFKLLDKVTSCLSDRFLENSDLRVYRDLEQIILGKFDMAAERDVSTDDAMSDIDMSLLQLEVKMMNALKITRSMPQFESVATLVQALLDKPPEVRMMFPETVKLANLLMVVPASSATAERSSFSSLRRVKAWL